MPAGECVCVCVLVLLLLVQMLLLVRRRYPTRLHAGVAGI